MFSSNKIFQHALVSFLLSTSFLIYPHTALAQADVPNYLQELVQQSKTLKLANHPQWHQLLHYRQSFMGSIESEADDPAFFTATNGKYSPDDELAATLSAFFSKEPWGEKQEPAQCAFIARYEWLNSQLHFDLKQLPQLACSQFDKWYAAINPGSLTLIFPSAYINNPSSMFGHTLLRVDTPNQTEKTRLLSYAINYGAETGNDNGVAFAVKGIFGGYHGTVGIGPYYKKVKEYSDTESRDIWEYQLNFTQHEIRRLLAHVWELRGVYFDYYFFDENCSYLVLTLLDVARPELKLSDNFSGWVIPSDTLRRLNQYPDLVKQVIYRPAAGTRLAHQASLLTQAEQTTALDLVNGTLPIDGLINQDHSETAQASILLLAHDYLRYEFLAGRHEKESGSRLSQQLLTARSTISTSQAPPPVPTPVTRPEQGHATGMVQLGFGSENTQDFLQLRLRPAYHDLLDNDSGYVSGAQIDFFNFSFNFKNDKLKLDEFNVIDIVSLSPRDHFFKPTSWRIRATWQRRILPDSPSPDRPSFRLDGGAGLSTHATDNILLYGLFNLGLDRNSLLKDKYTFGPGLETGLIAQPVTHWKIQLHAQTMNFITGEQHHYTTLRVAQRFAIGPQSAISLEWSQQRAFDLRTETWLFSLRHYL